MLIIFFSLILQGNLLFAQSTIEKYLHEGIANNEGMRQHTILLDKKIYALKEAKSLFFPSLSVGTSYAKSKGGRTIDLAIGDMLNPVYSTLNKLTNSQLFPEIENMSIQLNSNNYYDAGVRLSMPILNAEIYYNQKIKSKMLSMQETENLIYKRELIKEIKIAYYQYCQASKAVSIRENGVVLAKENFRINQSLYQNGKINHTSVSRSENEIIKTEDALFFSKQALKNNQAYFNFLLNKPFESEIIIDDKISLPDFFSSQEGVEKREELSKIEIASSTLHFQKQLTQSYLIPKVGTFVDLGSQGIDWRFNDKTRYYLFGASLEWTFSLGGKNLHKVKQANADLQLIESQADQTKKQLELQLFNAQNIYNEALNNYTAIQSQYKIAQKYYSDIIKGYKEGQLLYIELLDAQNQFINTELRLNIALYNVHVRYAEKERANANFNISNF